ncbi:MAG: nitroreductase family protein, partial [Erysipelotrichaceae bacterium]
MTQLEALLKRHSVRSYLSKPINQASLECLQEEITACNAQGDLHFQLITQDPKGFSGFLASYGKLENVENYIALVGKKSPSLD